jgi:hypothetical protein
MNQTINNHCRAPGNQLDLRGSQKEALPQP